MQSLMFLACFVQKLSKKNLWGVGSIPLSGKGRVNRLNCFPGLFLYPCDDEANHEYSAKILGRRQV